MNTAQDSSDTSRLPRYQSLVVVLIGLAAGICLDRQLGLPLNASSAAAVIAWTLWCCCWKLQQTSLAAICLLASIAAFGASWHSMSWRMFSGDELGLFASPQSQPVCVEAVASGVVERLPAPAPDPMRIIPQGESSRVDVTVTALRDGRVWRRASGRATLLVSGHLLGIRRGDRLRIFAQLAEPRQAQNPGQFDFARHARADRELSVLRSSYPDAVTVVKQASWFAPIAELRTQGDQLLGRYLNPRQAALAAALLLGQRSELSGEQTEAFFTTGTVHMLVVSGLHVGILAAALFLGLRLGWLPRRRALLIVVVLVILYALLTGGRPPVVRAAVIITIASLAAILGRQAAGFNTLAAAALVVLLWNPSDLFRTGPQLSFLAVAVLIGSVKLVRLQPSEDPLDRLLAETRPKWWRGSVWLVRWYASLTLASLAVWLVCLPLVMTRFHLLSPSAVLLSPLLWPALALALLSGFGVLMLGSLAPPLAISCAKACDASLWMIQATVDKTQGYRWSHYWVSGWPEWWLVGFYVALALAVALPQWRPPGRWCLAISAVWLAAGFAPWLLKDEDQLSCGFVALDHGLSTIVELPGGQTLLYDAGRMGSPQTSVRAISANLWSRGIHHLDALVISHADADHYNAIPELLKRFDVGVVYVSPVMFEDRTPALEKLRTAIESAGVPLREIWAGDRLHTRDDVRMDVIHPARTGVLGSDNANSIVLAIEYQGKRILLPGDLESPGLEDVIAELPYDCDVLLAPHHGSRNSRPADFSRWSTPDSLVISAGWGGNLEETRQAYESVGAQVFHTAESGSVEATIRQGEVSIEAWHVGH